MISLEKWMILAPLQKLPKNVEDLGKLIVAKGFNKLPKVHKIANSGHTGKGQKYFMSFSIFSLMEWCKEKRNVRNKRQKSSFTFLQNESKICWRKRCVSSRENKASPKNRHYLWIGTRWAMELFSRKR